MLTQRRTNIETMLKYRFNVGVMLGQCCVLAGLLSHEDHVTSAMHNCEGTRKQYVPHLKDCHHCGLLFSVV